jgi:hypothetical protein
MSMVVQIPDDSYNGDVAQQSDGTAGVRSDANGLKRWAVGIMANSAGVVKVKTSKGGTVKLGLQAGVPIALEIQQVFDTDTTVANADIVLFYSSR